MMRVSRYLKRWLPVDPDYAPFGWRLLRGLNAFPFALYLPIALTRSLSDLKAGVAFRGATPIGVVVLDGLWRVPVRLLLLFMLVTYLMVAAVAVLNASERLSNRWRIASLVAALVVTALLTLPVTLELYKFFGAMRTQRTLLHPLNASIVLDWLLFGVLATAPIYLRRRRQDALRALRDAKLQRVNVERQETERRLQSLQAQIEPHFLFNTLAHILRLHQVDAKRGREMLRSLTEYMASALPQVRVPNFTLGRELALTRAYVNVQQIRMGERLRVTIDVPAELMDARIPAMTVLTLAENAVKHGLGPKSEGGTLRIEARLKGEMLEVVVCDDGVGLQLGAGTGHGLANTRSRLIATYGRRAALSIANGEGGGVRAALAVPYAPVLAGARP